jgi:Cu-Zn family superoxide dismutase
MKSFLMLIFSFVLVSCCHTKKTETASNPPNKLIAVLSAKSDSKVKGNVEFTAAAEGVKLKIQMSGLKPNSTHGFHIHEFGDCTAPDASSAGGHFSTNSKTHGGPTSEMHHSGDLGNLQADSKGVIETEKTFNFFTIAGENSILGHSIVLHEKADDLKSQPAGDSGKRIACGVIGIAK